MDENIAVEKYARLVEQRRKAVATYYQKNKQEINDYNKSYYINHKEELANKRKQKRNEKKTQVVN